MHKLIKDAVDAASKRGMEVKAKESIKVKPKMMKGRKMGGGR